MSEMKYAIPKGMLKAVQTALAEHWKTRDLASGSTVDVVLEAALRWLSENPIVPTRRQIEEMKEPRFIMPHIDCSGKPPGSEVHISQTSDQLLIVEWQRRMFLAPEVPEVPEILKDLMLETIEEGFFKPQVLNERILEAYRRGWMKK